MPPNPPLLMIEKFTEGWVSPSATSNLQLDPSAAYDIKNVEYHPRGAISKREGFRSYTMSSTPITGVMKIFPWEDHAGNHKTFVYTTTSSGNLSAECYLVELSGAVASNVLTAQKAFSAELYTNRANLWSPNITADEIHVASYAGSAVAVAGGSGPPLIYHTTAGSAVPCTSVYYSGAKHIAAWGNYLFLGNILDSGTRERSRIQWNLGAGSIWLSAVSWPASYYIDLDADDGDEITGMHLLGDKLVVFKQKKIFLVWYTGDSTLFTYRRQSSDIGCIAGNTIIQKGEYLYFLGINGFYRFDGEAATEVSSKIKDKVIENVNHSLVSVHNAGIYEKHRQIWFAVNYTPFDAATENADHIRIANAIFVFDYELKNWTLYDIKASALASCVINTTTQAEDLIIGHFKQTDANRQSCLSKFGSQTSDTYQNAISSYWVSKWMDVQDPTRNKRLLRTTIIADQEGTETDTYSLTWEMREDWKEYRFNTTIASAAASGTALLTGSSTTLSGETLASYRTGNPMEIRVDLSRTFRAWQLKLSNAVSAHPWTVHKIVFEGMVKGRTKVT